MSLDERLRSGLRTMAEPVQDSERALHAFREHAYPRRARRRVLQGIGAVVVVGAIALGATTVTRNLAGRPNGYIERPKGMANCTNENLHLSSGLSGGPEMTIQTALTAVRTPCWVDVPVRLTITRNGSTAQFTADPLPIQGNGTTIRLRGVVPVGPLGHPAAAAPVLAVSWAWTNWCGHIKSMFFEFKTLDDGFSYINSLGWAPGNATCVDSSKPSVLKPIGQVIEMFDATPFPS